jgi:ATP-dependent RNA helicase DDX5/DBP2
LVEGISSIFKKFKGLSTDCIFSGSTDLINKSKNSNCDILVTTPGILFDLVSSGVYSLKNVSFVTIYEVERLFKHGPSHQSELSEIFSKIPNKPQTILFSDTWNVEIQKFSSLYCPDSVKINIEGNPEISVNPNISQNFILFSDPNERLEKFFDLVDELHKKNEKTIIFCSSNKTMNEICENFKRKRNFPFGKLTRKDSQTRRNLILEDFKFNRFLFLFSIDASSRGIDIPDISCVINFDFPTEHFEEHIYRIERIKRQGKALTFIGKNENYDFVMRLKNFVDKEKLESCKAIQYYLKMPKEEVEKLQKIQEDERRERNEKMREEYRRNQKK